MDESKQSGALDAAKGCAGSLDMDKITTCFNGQQAEDLLKTASDAFNKKLPGHTTIPHTFVNDDDVDPTYSALKAALCKAGSTASACGKVADAAKCVV